MSSHSLHDPRDLAARRAELDAADGFLTSLAQGRDVSAGEDPLAGLLLNLKAEVDAPLPPVPDVTEKLDPGAPTTRKSQGSWCPGLSKVGINSHRHRRQRPGGSRPWMMSVVGASVGALAASALIIVGGSVVYNAEPGDALWGSRVAIFGEPETNLVQLASAFDQVDTLVNEGDLEGARQVIDEARELIKYLDERERAVNQRRLDDAERSIAVPKTTTSISSTTVTETETEVVTVTQTPTPTSSEPTPTDGTDPNVNKRSQDPQAPAPSTTSQAAPQEPAPAPHDDLVDSVRRLTGGL